jgi:hypothetical protein
MMSKGDLLFDFLNSITHGKKDLLNDETVKSYNPFLVNYYVAMDKNLVFFADAMNRHGRELPKRLHYLFYLKEVPPKKRFLRYEKGTKETGLESMKKYFCVNTEKARDIMGLLSEDVIKSIISMYDTKQNLKQ